MVKSNNFAIERGGGASQLPLSREARGTLRSWALREIAPWQFCGLTPAEIAAALRGINNDNPQAYIFRIINGSVNIVPKPAGLEDRHHQYVSRAELYRDFFQDVVSRWLPNLSLQLALGMDDCWLEYSDVPTFSFQKLYGNSINVPDPDILMRDFLEDGEYVDNEIFSEKSPTAVFYGSTTGDLITFDKLTSRSIPRLNAAEFFYARDDVIFRLPQVVQCENEGVSRLLAEVPFCQGGQASWQEQFRHKFIISIDGNGATCSRVVLGLRSNSVLLKYKSDYQLYYFQALVPGLHFIPISGHQNVVDIVAKERSAPGTYGAIAAAGSAFANTYLTRDAIEFYAACVLYLYAKIVLGHSRMKTFEKNIGEGNPLMSVLRDKTKAGMMKNYYSGA